MSDAISNSLTICRADGSDNWNLLTTYKLAMGNTDYIGDPELETFKVDVPGRKGILDMSEALVGYPVFKTREISVHLGGNRPKNDWDGIISDLRMLYDGRTCKIIFDNDPYWYWTGRVRIRNFKRNGRIGEFDLVMTADAYKHKVTPTVDSYTAPDTVTIRSYAIPISPMFTASGGAISVVLVKDGEDVYTYQVADGETKRIPGLMTNTDYEVQIRGTADCSVTYEELSL